MRYSLFNGNWDLSHKVAVGATFTSLVLGIVVLVQSITISSNHERLVLVPPNMDQQYQIGWDSANAEYYQSMAIVAAGIIGSTTNSNVKNNLKTLNQLLSPPLQLQMEESLNALTNKLPKDNFNAWFIGNNTFYEKQTGKIFIVGNLYSVVVSSRIQEQPVVYEFIIKMQSGKPVITHFTSYEGTRPKTLAQMRADEQAAAARNNGAPPKPINQ